MDVFFLEFLLLHEFVHVSYICVFHDDVYVIAVVEQIAVANYVAVVERLQRPCLLDDFHYFFFKHASDPNGFHREVLTCTAILDQKDLSKPSPPKFSNLLVSLELPSI